MAGTASAPTSANAVINTLVFWDEGVSAYEQNDVNLALQKFWKIPDPSAKIFFNIGLMHQRLGNLEAAEKSFEATVFKDQHLAIGHYQLANIYFQEKKHLQAETSYSQSYECLRSKPYIDYKQLGLRYVLYECEILHNLALTSSVLKEKHKALELLDRAVTAAENCKQSKQHIEESRKSVQIGKPADLLELPKEAIFRPPKSKTSNIAKKDYLGKAKVVSAVTEKDDATGFVPVVKGKASYQSIKWKPNMAASTPTPVSHPAVDIIVKIHFQYTCAIKMKAGTSFADLNEIICKKFEKGSTQLNIWYKNDDHPELLHLNNEFRINDLWSSAKYGRLTLWCYEREGEEKQRDEKQVIALYDFAGQQSCDLSFKQGNVLSEVISIDDDWYQGQLHGKTGLFPKNYVKDLDLPLPSPMDSKAAPKPAGNASGVTRTGSSVRTKSNQSQKKPAEETPTSFGALMMELKTAAQRRSVYVDGDKNDKA